MLGSNSVILHLCWRCCIQHLPYVHPLQPYTTLSLGRVGDGYRAKKKERKKKNKKLNRRMRCLASKICSSRLIETSPKEAVGSTCVDIKGSLMWKFQGQATYDEKNYLFLWGKTSVFTAEKGMAIVTILGQRANQPKRWTMISLVWYLRWFLPLMFNMIHNPPFINWRLKMERVHQTTWLPRFVLI